MPYRINPKNKRQVQQLKAGRWVTIKTHKSATQARKHQQALYLNVTAKGKG